MPSFLSLNYVQQYKHMLSAHMQYTAISQISAASQDVIILSSVSNLLNAAMKMLTLLFVKLL